MAKYEVSFKGNFRDFLSYVENDILKDSLSSSFEDGSDVIMNDVHVATRVYERYSMTGSNRVSLNVTIVGYGSDISVSAITSGGSQAMLFKINRFGEESFLNNFKRDVERYMNR